jgi:hypothetical protein
MTNSTDNLNDEWCTIATVEGDTFAEMAVEALENEDIVAAIVRSNLSAGLGVHGVSVANISAQIRVREEDVKRAREIVETILGNVSKK